jgi:hypothetical protein
MLKNAAEYERDISLVNFTAISNQVSPDSLLGVSVGIYQITLVDESGIIRSQMERTVDQKIAPVHRTLSTIPPHNS